MNRQLIEEYAAGGDAPRKAIAGLAREQLTALPVPGTWSIAQIVLHLMDSDLIASDRMKRIIAEEKPSLIGYDETAFSRTLFYQESDVALACEIFEKNRRLTADILRRLPEEAFRRTGLHNERGEVTLADLVETYVGHVGHHLKFVADKRRLVERS